MNYLLEQFVKWTLNKVTGLIGVMNELIASVSTGLMNEGIIRDFLTASQIIIAFFGVIGVIMWIFNFRRASENGSAIFDDQIKSLIIGLLFTTGSIPAMKYIYEIGMNTASKIGKTTLDTKFFNDDSILNAFIKNMTISGISTVFLLIVAIVLLVEMFKVFKQQIKRFPVIIAHAPLACCYVVSIFMGNIENALSWGKSCMGVMISHVIQIAFIIIGFSLLTNGGSIGKFIVGLGFVLTSSKLDQLFGQWATSTQGSGYQSGVGRLMQSAVFMFRK